MDVMDDKQALKDAWLHLTLRSEGWALTLRNAYLDAEARARKAEFWLEHTDCQDGPAYDPDGAPCKCEDERHNWELAQWREALVKELEAG